jgi:hypothetical protein
MLPSDQPAHVDSPHPFPLGSPRWPLMTAVLAGDALCRLLAYVPERQGRDHGVAGPCRAGAAGRLAPPFCKTQIFDRGLTGLTAAAIVRLPTSGREFALPDNADELDSPDGGGRQTTRMTNPHIYWFPDGSDASDGSIYH